METRTATKTNLTHDQIAARAYHIWETSGRPAGSEMRHWLQAEEELATKLSQPSAKPAQKAADQPAERKEHEPARAQSNKRPGAASRDPSQGAQEHAATA